MSYRVVETNRGIEVLEVREVFIGLFLERADAELFVEAKSGAARQMIEAPEVTPPPPEPPAAALQEASPSPDQAKSSPDQAAPSEPAAVAEQPRPVVAPLPREPRHVDTGRMAFSDDELAEALQRVGAGEKVTAVADDMGKDWKILRSAWARHCKAGNRPEPTWPQDRDCITCGKRFKSHGVGNRMCSSCGWKSYVEAPA